MLKLGLMDIAVGFMDPSKAASATQGSTDPEDGPEALAARSRTLVARLLSRAPDCLSIPLEAELLQHLFADLEGTPKAVARAASVAEDEPAGEAVERLELTVRMLAVLITKTPGALDRLAQKVPQIEEVDDSAAVGKVS